MLEFQKLEKLEFGGTGGKGYNEQVTSIYVEFQEHCEAFRKSERSPQCLSTKVMTNMAGIMNIFALQ